LSACRSSQYQLGEQQKFNALPFYHHKSCYGSRSDPARLVAIFRTVASPGYPFPERWAREAATLSQARSPRDPRTTRRQLAAGRATKLPPLSRITVPTLVGSGADGRL
jgi:hypothetical protein